MTKLHADLLLAAQLRDVQEMNRIYSAACYIDQDKCDVNRICRNVVGNGPFNLSPVITEAIIHPKGVLMGGGIVGGKEQV